MIEAFDTRLNILTQIQISNLLFVRFECKLSQGKTYKAMLLTFHVTF